MSNKVVTIKTQDDLKIMRAGGKVLAEIVQELSKSVIEGSSGAEVDKYAHFLCKRYKVKPAFYGYGGFTGAICANLNEVVVHGTPTNAKFKSGDIFGLDMGIVYQGFYLDMSVTLTIGKVSIEVRDFLDKTYKSMMQGIEAAKPGNRVGKISAEMGRGLLSKNFSLMRDFVGHGIGKDLHEAPEIPGFGMKEDEGMELVPGMVVAIESISVLGPSIEYKIAPDRWTVYTKDRKYLSGLYEHTVILTDNGPEIITIIDKN